MPTTQINQLPAGIATDNAIVAADNAELTATEKIKLGDIAKLATNASQLTQGTLPDARLSSNIVRTNDARLSDARVPLAHNQGAETITTGTLSDARLSANVPLLVNGLIPASVLPSFVDDVLEFNDVASFPATGEANKIYVVLTGGNANKTYRWSGSAYVEVSPSPGSTDAVPEGATNLYFTDGRAAAAAPVQSVAGKTGTITLEVSDIVGLLDALNAIADDVRWNIFLPPLPTNVSGNSGAGQVLLTWTAPSVIAQAPVTDYLIQYKQSGAATWSLFSDGVGSTTSATITGLTNGTAYVFRVAAVNAIGAGSYSAESAPVTPIATPAAPTSLAATAGDQQISLSWTAPGNNGGSSITGYRVEYTPAGGSAQTVNTGSTDTSYVLTGLVNDTAYTVRVAAINAAGVGSYSSPAYGTPANSATAPDAPTNLSGTPGNNQASLTWTEPNDNGATITDYLVQYSADGGTTWLGDGIPTDPYFANVALLLHMDGSGNTFTDSSSYNRTIVPHGSASQTTFYPKFGSKCGDLSDPGGAYLTVTGAAMPADFTVETWVKFLSTFNNVVLFDSRTSDLDAAGFVLVRRDTNKMAFWHAGAFTAFDGGTLSNEVWHHVAFVRVGTTVTCYLNGVAAGTATLSGNLTNTGYFIGSAFSESASVLFLDDFRVTVGHARYTANFTPPTAAFPNA